MSDPRHFAKLDLGYFDNPKIADFMDERPRVMIMHLRAILYCRQHLTDGLFPIRAVARLAYASYCGSQCESQCESQCDFCAAHDAELFERVDARNALVHDYLEHQDSAEKVSARKSAGQAGAAARWNAKGDANRNAKGNADRTANGNAEKRREEKRDTRADAIASDFDEWYALYPRKRDRGHALKAYKAARKKVSHDTLMDALRAQREELVSKGVEFCAYAATWLNGERWTDETAQTLPVIRPAHYRDYGSEATA